MGTVIAAISTVIITTGLHGGGGSNPTALPAGTQNVQVVAASSTPVDTAPVHAIVGGAWTLQYNVLSNDCGFGPDAGQLVTLNMSFDEAAPNDAYVSEGEEVDVSDQSYEVGRYQFTYPTFAFQEPVTESGYSGTANISITFEGTHSGHGSRAETYTDGQGGSCTIAASN